MNRIFSNGPSKDFVFNPFKNLMRKAARLYVAAPYVTETKDLLRAAESGTVIHLLVGLNGSTSPQALSLVHGVPNIAVRYLTHRFHAKIYIADTSALLGSSNLTDGGLRSNREATIYLDQPDDHESIEDIRRLFVELWDSANVLTSEILDKFTKKFNQLKRSGPDVDALIEAAVGRVEPANINVSSAKKTSERIFLEGLRRQIEEQYRPSFNEVTKVLEDNNFRRPKLEAIGSANETNRFLNWVRLTHAPEDAWESAPLRPKPEDRRAEIVRLGLEWTTTDKDKIPTDYIDQLHTVRDTFGTKAALESATKEALTQGFVSVHAFAEQSRFVKGGASSLPDAFWASNDQSVAKVKRTMLYLIHGGGEFVSRLHDVLYEPAWKLAYFGQFCALELYGTVKPDDYPPVNGRMAKALRFLGFEVRGA